MYHLAFNFATDGPAHKLGRGVIELWHDNTLEFWASARTGSVSKELKLINPIHQADWWIIEKSVDTDEPGMCIGGMGWKIRFWLKAGPMYRHTHYLLHPDGTLPGSLGCIVTPTVCLELRNLIDGVLKDKQDKIPLIINESEAWHEKLCA